MGLNLVLTGLGFFVTKWQLRTAAVEIGWEGAEIGEGHAIAGVVLLGLGIATPAYAYRRRGSVDRWSIATEALVAGFVLTGNLVGLVVTRHVMVLI